MIVENVKALVSTEVIGKINDEAVALVLRNILFNENNTIKWDRVYEDVMKFMPELKANPEYQPRNMRVPKLKKYQWGEKSRLFDIRILGNSKIFIYTDGEMYAAVDHVADKCIEFETREALNEWLRKNKCKEA